MSRRSEGGARHEDGDARVQDELAQALVRPGPVNEQQLLEEAELADGDVGRARRLQTLVARDADANMGSLNHRHIVGAVSNGEQDGLEVLLDELDDEGLLQRRHTAAHDRLAHDGELEERL